MALIDLTSEELLKIGLEYIGHHQKRQKSNKVDTRRFHAAYKVCPETVRDVLNDLQTTDIPAARIDRPNLKYVFLSLSWMKTYDTGDNLAGHWDLDPKTVRAALGKYAPAIQALKELKVSFLTTTWLSSDLDRLDRATLTLSHLLSQIRWVWGPGHNDQTVFIASVDGVHFRINEPRSQPNANWCSHKFNHPALSYELGVSLVDGSLVWINGPFPAATSDVAIFRKPNGLAAHIPAGKKVIADRGCRPALNTGKLAIRNPYDSDALKEFKRRVRARHENFNARIKHFRVLDERSRHPLEKHKTVLEAACVLQQYDLENGHSLFEI